MSVLKIHVFKINKVRIVDGKKAKVPSKRYYGKYKDSTGNWIRVALFTDKASSLYELQKRARQAEQVQSGLIEADTSNGLKTPLDEHLEAYAEAVEKRKEKIGSNWCEEQKEKIGKVLRQAKAVMPLDATSARIKGAIDKLASSRQWSKRTSNHYIKAVKAFFAWMMAENRIGFNPAQGIKTLEVKDCDLVHSRRTFTQAEVGALVEYLYASKDQRKVVNPPRMRALLYALAFQTGLRAKELMSITPSSFDLENSELAIHGRETKNGVSEIIPLPSTLVTMVTTILAERKNPTSIFKGVYFRGQAGKRLKLDMEHARLHYIKSAPTQAERTTREQSDFLQWENARGEYLDFHSFRSSFITSLVENGATIKQVQLLARHKDATTTLKHYIKCKNKAELAGVVSALPALMVNTPQNENKKGHQEGHQNLQGHQEGHQNLEPLGYLESSQETEIKNSSESQVIERIRVGRDLQRKMNVHPTGIEPVTFGFVGRHTLESEPLETKHDEHFAKSEGHQEGHQNFQDERFAELARAWSTLPKSTQLGIIALVDIAKANSLESGISGIIGTMPTKARAHPCPSGEK